MTVFKQKLEKGVAFGGVRADSGEGAEGAVKALLAAVERYKVGEKVDRG